MNYSTVDHPTDQARAHVAGRVAAFLDQLRRDALHDLDHLRTVAAAFEAPLDLSDVPESSAGELRARHHRRHREAVANLSATRDRLAAVNEAIEALP